MLRFWIETTAKLSLSKSCTAFLGLDVMRKKLFLSTSDLTFLGIGRYWLKERLTCLRLNNHIYYKFFF